MRRRGFFGALAGLCLAPLGFKRPESVRDRMVRAIEGMKFQSPLTRRPAWRPLGIDFWLK